MATATFRSGRCPCVVDWCYVAIYPAYFAPQDRLGKRSTENWKKAAPLKTMQIFDLSYATLTTRLFLALTAQNLFNFKYYYGRACEHFQSKRQRI